jgi:hypothetical protein
MSHAVALITDDRNRVRAQCRPDLPRHAAAILTSTMPQPDRPHGICARTT